MNRYFLALLGVAIIVLSSFLYKESRSRILSDFPKTMDGGEESQTIPILRLFLFFNSENCQDCLKVVEVLNDLPPHFRVLGLVPLRDFRNPARLKEATGVKFGLACHNSFKRFLPHYAPTLIGTTTSGKVLFVLPAVPGESDYLSVFLDSFYRRAYQLLREKGPGET